MIRAAEVARSLLAVLVGVASVLALVILAASVISPDLAKDVSLSEVPGQASAPATSELLKIDWLLDLSLLIGAYLLVCVFTWLQSELPIYLANRRRFQ